jgi:hypothetical protein
VQSTFAGHYDFAIYLDLVLPIVLALLYTRSKKSEELGLATIFVIGVWALIVSGLRSAFASYVVITFLVTGLFALQQKTWLEKFRWFTPRITVLAIFTSIMFIVFGSNLSALLTHAAAGLLGGSGKPNSIDQTIISQYQLPVPKNQVDQYKLTGGTKPEELSGCALQKEISLCIRLESLWPQAITGFMRMPLLGSGYSSLNKRDFYHLSEADGTDNNYLRMLGETGVLGFLTFAGIITAAVMYAVKIWRTNKTQRYLVIAFIAVVTGVLLNAVLFDVFAASKVAFGFWAVTGMCLSASKLKKNKHTFGCIIYS